MSNLSSGFFSQDPHRISRLNHAPCCLFWLTSFLVLSNLCKVKIICLSLIATRPKDPQKKKEHIYICIYIHTNIYVVIFVSGSQQALQLTEWINQWLIIHLTETKGIFYTARFFCILKVYFKIYCYQENHIFNKMKLKVQTYINY